MSGTALPTDRHFDFQRDETSVGLVDMKARLYSSSLGRFISPDTVIPRPSDPQAFNRFAYTRNSPINLTDPTGHYEACDTEGPCRSGDDSSDSRSVQRRATIPSGARLAKTRLGGTIDLEHAKLGVGFIATIWEIVKWAVNSKTAVSGAVKHPMRGNDSVSDVRLNFAVAAGLKAEDVAGVVLGIYMRFQSEYENAQAQLGIAGGWSSNSFEDLPSDFVSFYMSIKDASLEQALYDLGGVTGVSEFNIGPITVGGFVGEVAQSTFNPKNSTFEPQGGAWPTKYAKVLSVAKDPTSGLWRVDSVSTPWSRLSTPHVPGEGPPGTTPCGSLGLC